MQGFLIENWGNVAGVLGLVVSIATLAVAQSAQQAAREARDAARRRSLAEEIRDALSKVEQIGVFLPQSRWDIVWLRAQEIVSVASMVRSRWEDHLSDPSRDNLLVVRQLSQSIASAALLASATAPTRAQMNRIAATHGRVLELLGGELGRVLAVEERGSLP